MSRYVDLSNYEDCKIVLHQEDEGIKVKDLPTADVEEVRCGRWSFDEDECVATCTVCGTVYEDRGDTIPDYWGYCPKCGAKMDGGKE
jgi:hypothetical protein